MVRRRDVLSTIATGSVFGSALGSFPGRARAATAKGAAMSHGSTGGSREERVQFVEAKPDAGFNFPYFLARPESFRSGDIPLMVEMNNADEEDSFEKVKEGRAGPQISLLGFQGAWLSEELGIPHLKPVVPMPSGDPVDSTHRTINLNRRAMLLEGTKFDRIDLQILRMADHARQQLLSERQLHDKVIFYGNSSEGRFAVRISVMHPEEILAVAAGGINGFVTLPLEELGSHTLNYPVGVADLESIIGKPYDAEAHTEVNKLFFMGGEDEKNPLPMRGGIDYDEWNDREVYDAAVNVYGEDFVEDRFTRCYLAYRKAGIDAQFRVYPGMKHDPRPASHDIRTFLERSIEGEDVSELGQRFELPFDRDIEVAFEKVEGTTVRAQFDVTGKWPPPVGLVSYDWTFGDGSTGSGRPIFNEYTEPGSYEIAVTMETVEGQRAERSIEYVAEMPAFALETAELSAEELDAGDGVSLVVTVTNVGNTAGEIPIQFAVDGTAQVNTTVELDVDESKNLEFQQTFDKPGKYQLSLNGEPAGSVTVESPPTPTVKPTSSPTQTQAETPGFGVLSALAGIGSAVGYQRYRSNSDEP